MYIFTYAIILEEFFFKAFASLENSSAPSLLRKESFQKTSGMSDGWGSPTAYTSTVSWGTNYCYTWYL